MNEGKLIWRIRAESIGDEYGHRTIHEDELTKVLDAAKQECYKHCEFCNDPKKLWKCEECPIKKWFGE